MQKIEALRMIYQSLSFSLGILLLSGSVAHTQERIRGKVTIEQAETNLEIQWIKSSQPSFKESADKSDRRMAVEPSTEVRAIAPNTPIERSLNGTETHIYELTVDANQYLELTVEQQGIDVVISLFTPDHQQILQVDDIATGIETLRQILETSGTYRLEIKPYESEATAGRYVLEVTQLRVATEQDKNQIRDRALAQEFYHRGEQLRQQGTAESLNNAIAQYEQAIALWESTEYFLGVAAGFHSIGLIYNELNEPEKAIEYYNQALPIWEELGEENNRAFTLSALGVAFAFLGDKQKALNYYEQSLAIHRTLQNRSGEGSTLYNIARVYQDLGELQQALEYFNQVLPIREAAGDRAGVADTLNATGGIYTDLGDLPQALEYYHRALKIFQEIEDQRGEARVYNSMGIADWLLGEPDQAIEYYQQALPLRRATGDRYGESVTLNNLATVYVDIGEYQQAFETYNQALELAQAIRDKKGTAVALNNIGLLYDSLGDSQQAIAYYDQSLPLRREVGDKLGEATTLNNLAALYSNLGENEKALDAYTQALSLLEATGSLNLQASTLSNIGVLYSDLGNYDQGEEYHNQALELRRKIGDRQGEAVSLNNLGRVARLTGNFEQAIAYLQPALELMKAVKNPSGEAMTLYSMALVERDRGNLETAIAQIEDAIAIAETLRNNIRAQDLKTSFFASVQDYYELYIDLLMQQHKKSPKAGLDAKALQASERARARSLLELLTEANADIRQGVDPQLLEQEQRLQKQLEIKIERQQQLLNSDRTGAELSSLQSEINSLLNQYQQVQGLIRENSPRYAALTQPQPLNLSEIQQQVLDENTLLLEYSLGSDRSYLWAVTTNTITSYELPPRAEIEAAARSFQESLTAPSMRIRPAIFNQAAAELSEIILQPVAAQLNQKRLLIVADGVLQYTPFSALSISANHDAEPIPLIVNHEIVTLPSASTIGILRRELNGRTPAKKAIAVIADPVFEATDDRVTGGGNLQNNNLMASLSPASRSARTGNIPLVRLPFTRTEAEQILALVPDADREEAFDFSANRAIATSDVLSEYRIIHLATHGILNSAHPELSGIVLSLVDPQGNPQNGFLRLQDIYNLNLPAELVVLSACQTGLGEEIRGEGLVGLTRGFMYAGASRVVVSLWSVDDRATAELMTRFYRGMLQEGKKPVTALRDAQVQMWQETEWKSPYYWAAFTLQGEWR